MRFSLTLTKIELQPPTPLDSWKITHTLANFIQISKCKSLTSTSLTLGIDFCKWPVVGYVQPSLVKSASIYTESFSKCFPKSIAAPCHSLIPAEAYALLHLFAVPRCGLSIGKQCFVMVLCSGSAWLLGFCAGKSHSEPPVKVCWPFLCEVYGWVSLILLQPLRTTRAENKPSRAITALWSEVWLHLESITWHTASLWQLWEDPFPE